MWQKIVTLYAANGKFHALVVAIEMALVSFGTSYNGGLPVTKAAWVSLGFAVGGAIWGGIKGWLRNDVAIATVQGVGATKAQTAAVASTAKSNQAPSGK